MSTPLPAGPSPPRTAIRLLAELAGFALLLFVSRFLARGHLIPLMDQECHIGGIALEVLAHGIRFPLMVYAPNEYDNGSFFSGLLAAVSYSLLGPNVLALKLVTHMFSAAGAVAALSLLRGCLDELGVTDRRTRWTAIVVLVLAIAFAPRVVTLCSMYAVGNHAEGAAIDTILLALFSRRLHSRSAARVGTLWGLVGFALYLNKATLLVIPVFAAAEVVLAWRNRALPAAALVGFVLGMFPEVLVIIQRHGMGWEFMASKAELSAPEFPRAFLDSLWTLADFRPELLALWSCALVGGSFLLVRALQAGHRDRSESPGTFALVLAVTWIFLVELAVMAQGGLDAYALYGHPTLSVLVASLVGWTYAQVASRLGPRRGWVVPAMLALSLVMFRPDALTWSAPTVAALWRNHDGAACSWRFAEGFEREHDHGLAAPDRSREQHAIERCRTLVDASQRLDCIGGIARELNWRHGGRIAGEPPAALTAKERTAYAYHYGTHRRGDLSVCSDFTDPDLRAQCAAAVTQDCLVFGDVYTRFFTARGLGTPHCSLLEPPMNSYWGAIRNDLLARTNGVGPDISGAAGWDADPAACKAIFDACY